MNYRVLLMLLIPIYISLIHTFISSWQKSFYKDFWSHGIWGLLSWLSGFFRLLLDIFWGQVSGRISRVNWLQFILMLETVGCCILPTSWMSGCFLGKPGLHQRFI